MPISKINQDGSVRIYNTVTGETKDVAPTDLAKYSPKLVSDYQTELKKQQSIQSAIKSVSQGAIKISDLPAEQRATVADQIISSGKTIPVAPAADTKKKQDSLKAVNNLINNLQKHYEAAGGGQQDFGPLARILGVVKGTEAATGINSEASTYNDEKAGFAASLKQLTGDTGVLTDQDYKRLSKLLPGLGSTKQEAQNKLNDLRSQMNAVYGGIPQKTTIPAQTSSQQPTGNPITDTLENNPITKLLLGSVVNTAQDVGTGVRNIMQQPQLQKQEQQAKALEDQAVATNDPALKKSFLQQANVIRQQVSGVNQDTSHAFTQDVNQDPITRSLEGASQIATTAEIPGLAKAGLNLGKKSVSVAGKAVHPFKSVGAYRDTAIKQATGKTISGDSLLSDLEAGANKISPTDIKAYANFLDTARSSLKGKNLTIDNIVDLNHEANKAYTAAGKVGKSAKATFNDILSKSIKSQLQTTAPDVAKANKMFSKLYKGKKVAGRVGSQAGNILIGAALGRLLFGNNNQ